MPPTFVAVLVAAGRSERMGTDKLWADLWGRPAWRWALDALLATPGLVRVAIAVPAASIERFRAALPADGLDRCEVVAGGDARADSVVAGLLALTRAGHGDATVTLVHDAARPAVTPMLISVIAAAAAASEDAVVPVVAVPDTLKRIRGGRVVAPVDREEVAAAQTPQAARLGALRAAIEEAHAWKRPITDDVGALAAAGNSVRVVPGEAANRKLTEPDDLAALRGILAAGATPVAAPGTAAALPNGVRCGIGFDAHRLVAGRQMRIGGVVFEGEDRGPEDTPTATPSFTRSSTPCSAAPSSATSGPSSHPKTWRGRVPTRATSCGGRSSGSPSTGGVPPRRTWPWSSPAPPSHRGATR